MSSAVSQHILTLGMYNLAGLGSNLERLEFECQKYRNNTTVWAEWIGCWSSVENPADVSSLTYRLHQECEYTAYDGLVH